MIAPLMRSLEEQNYQTPTPIQQKTIPWALEGYDILGCAQTGTGKTAAFALPILDQLGEERVRAKPNRPQALILAPTRELAIQIGDSLTAYGRHVKLRHTVIFGGVKQHSQVRALRQGVHILVATPGRLIDLIDQGHVHLDELEIFVLDEADRMLDMGFLPDIKRITKLLPQDRQSLFFSATMPPKISELAEELLFQPVRVAVKSNQGRIDRIEQKVYWLEQSSKQSTLHDLLAGSDVGQAIVFTRTKRGANIVGKRLTQHGICAAIIHGNKSQAARQRALDGFRDEKIRVLVATDVAARGIDVDGITHVINFDLPNDPESYVHRIGRTGRAGASGVAITFCTADQQADLLEIEKTIRFEIPVEPGFQRPANRNGHARKPSSRSASNGRSGRQRSGQQSFRSANNRKRRSGSRQRSKAVS